MLDPTKPLLLDFFHLAWVMLVFGLLAYSLIRRSNPLIRWNEHGNVWTEPFQALDLGVMVFILGFYYYGIYSAVMATEPPPSLSEVGIVPALMAQNVMMIFLVGGVVSTLVYARRVDVRELFGLKRLSFLKIILWTVGVLAVTYPIIILVSGLWNSWLEYTFAGAAPQQDLVKEMRENDVMGVGVKLLMAFSICVITPITEEVLFRGYLYPALKRFSERLFAAIVVSLFFAVVHGNTGSLLPLFFFAMALTVAYEVTGCLLVPIAMHAIFNLLTVIAIFYGASHG